jgi:hypothetical protein
LQLTGPVTGAQVRDALVVLIHHNLVVPEAKFSAQDSFSDAQHVAQSHCTYRLCHRRTLMLMRHARFVARATEIFGQRGAWLVAELLICGRATAQYLLDQTALRVTSGDSSVVTQEFAPEIQKSSRRAAIQEALAQADEQEEEEEDEAEEGGLQQQAEKNREKIKAMKASPVYAMVHRALGQALDRLVIDLAVEEVAMFGAKTVSDGVETGEEEMDLAELAEGGKGKKDAKRKRDKATEDDAADAKKKARKKKKGQDVSKAVKGEKSGSGVSKTAGFGGAKDSARKVDGRVGPRELEMSVELQLLMGGGASAEDEKKKKKKAKKDGKGKNSKDRKGKGKLVIDSDDDDDDDDDEDSDVAEENARKRKQEEVKAEAALKAKRARLDAGSKAWWRVSFRFFMQQIRADKVASYAKEKTGVPLAGDIIDWCCAATRLSTIARRVHSDKVEPDFLLPDYADAANTAALLDDGGEAVSGMRDLLAHKFVKTVHVLVAVMCSPRINILAKDAEGHVREGVRFPSVNVNFRAIIDILRRECVLDIASSRYGPKAARVMRLLQAKGQLEQKEVGDLAMLPPKDARAALYMLLKGGMLKLHEISKRPDMAPTNTFFMWSVDMEGACKQLAACVCRALVNLRLRRRAILSRNHSLIQSFQHLDMEAAAEAATSNLTTTATGAGAGESGKKDSAATAQGNGAVEDPDATKSVEGLKRYHRMRHALEKLDAQMLRFDDTYMVLCEM